MQEREGLGHQVKEERQATEEKLAEETRIHTTLKSAVEKFFFITFVRIIVARAKVKLDILVKTHKSLENQLAKSKEQVLHLMHQIGVFI